LKLLVANKIYREGNDGPWSTFAITAGTPGNVTRVLVSTAISNTWVCTLRDFWIWADLPKVVLAQACTDSSCANSRGGSLFNENSSKTWDQVGIFDLYYEELLNYTGNGLYGLDTVSLGYQQSNASTLTGQVVAGIIQDDFWLGYFGINPQPTNFTNFNHPIPSFFQTLKDQNKIPSLSYSYTAGAQYRKQFRFH
jgi:hypothetical protein